MNRALKAPSILDDFHALEAMTRRPVRSAAELDANLSHIYAALAGIDLDARDLDELKDAAPALMQGIFELRMKIKGQIADWHRLGLVTPAVEKSIRDVFRVSRYAGDMLGELNDGYDQLDPGEMRLRAFSGANYNTLVNPGFNDGYDIPFRDGDVMLVRGTAHNSAAIARIGDVDTQFSHVGIIHFDREGKGWMVEALIEQGSSITPLEEALSHDLGRAVLYRHRNADLAAGAARLIHDRVKKSLGRLRRPILYDFTMRLEGYETLYCSKLIRSAFEGASLGQVILPTFKTRLDMKNRDFFDAVGVSATETFAPGDIDIEPEFDLVAEWQDYRMTSALRMQDLLMDKIFEWMEKHGWKFEEDFMIRLVSVLGKGSSYLSEEAKNLMKSVAPKVPINMPRRTIAVIAMLHRTGEGLLQDLKAFEQNTIRMRGRPAMPREIDAHLESVRERSGGHIGYLAAPRIV